MFALLWFLHKRAIKTSAAVAFPGPALLFACGFGARVEGLQNVETTVLF